MQAKPNGGGTPLCHSITEACERLCVGRSKFYELIQEAHIECVHVGSRALIPETELQRFLSEMQLLARLNRVLAPKFQRLEMRQSRHRGVGRFFLEDEKGKVLEPSVDLRELEQTLDLRRVTDPCADAA